MPSSTALASPLQQQPHKVTASDEELLARARKGDRGAFSELVDTYQSQIAATVVSMLGPSQEVDDVVQEVFIRFYQTLDRFRGEASLRTYLTRIAINKTLDVLRRRKRSLARVLSRDDERFRHKEPATDERDVHDAQERAQLVRAAIEKLPPKQRAVVVLRMIEGYSTEETAEILNLAYGTVLSRLSRALGKLKKVLLPLLT